MTCFDGSFIPAHRDSPLANRGDSHLLVVKSRQRLFLGCLFRQYL